MSTLSDPLRDEVELLLNKTSSLVSAGGTSDAGRSSALRPASLRGGTDALSEAASRLKSSFDSTSDKIRQFKKSASFREPLSVSYPRSGGREVLRLDSPMDSPGFSNVRDQAAPSIALTDRSMAVLERSASMSSPTGMGTVTNVYNSFAGLQDMVTQVDELMSGVHSAVDLGSSTQSCSASSPVPGRGSLFDRSGLRSTSRLGSPMSPRSPSRLRSIGGLIPSSPSTLGAAKGSRKQQLASLLGKEFVNPPDVTKFRSDAGMSPRPPQVSGVASLTEKLDKLNRKLTNWSLVEDAARDRFASAFDAALDSVFAQVDLHWPPKRSKSASRVQDGHRAPGSASRQQQGSQGRSHSGHQSSHGTLHSSRSGYDPHDARASSDQDGDWEHGTNGPNAASDSGRGRATMRELSFAPPRADQAPAHARRDGNGDSSSRRPDAAQVLGRSGHHAAAPPPPLSMPPSYADIAPYAGALLGSAPGQQGPGHAQAGSIDLNARSLSGFSYGSLPTPNAGSGAGMHGKMGHYSMQSLYPQGTPPYLQLPSNPPPPYTPAVSNPSAYPTVSLAAPYQLSSVSEGAAAYPQQAPPQYGYAQNGSPNHNSASGMNQTQVSHLIASHSGMAAPPAYSYSQSYSPQAASAHASPPERPWQAHLQGWPAPPSTPAAMPAQQMPVQQPQYSGGMHRQSPTGPLVHYDPYRSAAELRAGLGTAPISSPSASSAHSHSASPSGYGHIQGRGNSMPGGGALQHPGAVPQHLAGLHGGQGGAPPGYGARPPGVNDTISGYSGYGGPGVGGVMASPHGAMHAAHTAYAMGGAPGPWSHAGQ